MAEPLGLGQFRDPMAPFLTSAFNRMEGYVQMALVDTFVQAAKAAGQAASKQLLEMARVFEEETPRQELQGIHQAIARQAQSSVLRSYGQSVKRRGGPSGYRRGGDAKWQRYAGGRLRDALADASFYEANEFGIGFINVALLNKRAAQWARLNFGAGQRGAGRRPRQFDVSFGSVVVASLGLHESARPAFWIPRGYWFDGAEAQFPNAGRRGQDAFYVMGTGPMSNRSKPFRRGADGSPVEGTGIIGKRLPTRGIQAKNFFDAGIATIARETPKRYKALLDDQFERGVSRVRPSNITIHVRQSRPRY